MIARTLAIVGVAALVGSAAVAVRAGILLRRRGWTFEI